MRRYLFVAFLGLWIAVFPYLPIGPGSTQKFALTISGLLVALLAFWSLRETNV